MCAVGTECLQRQSVSHLEERSLPTKTTDKPDLVKEGLCWVSELESA